MTYTVKRKKWLEIIPLGVGVFGIVSYLFAWLAAVVFITVIILQGQLPPWLLPQVQALQCSIAGVAGGITYCMRVIYVNRCALNRWDSNWHTWYYLRPVTSLLAGVAAYIFLRAGLLTLDVQTGPDSNGFGFIAFSYIAGLNVDNFYERLENIAKSAWGIKPSNISKRSKSEE